MIVANLPSHSCCEAYIWTLYISYKSNFCYHVLVMVNGILLSSVIMYIQVLCWRWPTVRTQLYSLTCYYIVGPLSCFFHQNPVFKIKLVTPTHLLLNSTSSIFPCFLPVPHLRRAGLIQRDSESRVGSESWRLWMSDAHNALSSQPW